MKKTLNCKEHLMHGIIRGVRFAFNEALDERSLNENEGHMMHRNWIVLLLMALAFAIPFCHTYGDGAMNASSDVRPAGILKIRTSADVKDSIVGIEIFPATDLPYINRMGACFVRLDVPWCIIEKEKGNFNYQNTFDKRIEAIRSNNLKGLFILCYGNKLYAEGLSELANSADGLAAWKRYVHNTVARYKDCALGWEIWNEPDGWGVLDRNTVGTVSDYMKLLKAASEEIRSIQPDAQICMGGVANADIPFIKGCLDAGAGNYVDKIGIHPYRELPEFSTNLDPLSFRINDFTYEASISELRRMIRGYGKNLDLWTTEHGMQSKFPSSGACFSFPSSELSQAKYTLRRFIVEQALEMKSVLFYAVDGPWTVGGDCVPNNKSIVNRDGNPKLAYYAMQNFCAIFDSAVRPATDIDVAVNAISYPTCKSSNLPAVVIEAEAPFLIEAPMFIGKDSDASGGEFLTSPESPATAVGRSIDPVKYPAGKNDFKGLAKYEFMIEKPGKYYVLGRVKAPHMCGTSDSFIVKVDDGKEITWDLIETGNNWSWQPAMERHYTGMPETYDGAMNLSQGKHVLTIKTREDGACLDKIELVSSIDEKIMLEKLQAAPLMSKVFINARNHPIVCLWKATDLIDWQRTLKANATIKIKTDKIKKPVFVDLLSKDHLVYELKDFERSGDSIIVKNAPVSDSPVVIADRSDILGE